nr:SRPBCC family protein [Mucilaginibacter straminoryzae]
MAEAWKFFSSPLNLGKITPPNMKFIVTSDYDENTVMYPGMIITYKVSPLLNVKMNWVTEITHVQEPNFFVDDQRLGPFALWHHEHHFEEIPGGVHMTDILTYAVGYGPLGSIANMLMVKKRIADIFKYREKAVIELFGEFKPVK